MRKAIALLLAAAMLLCLSACGKKKAEEHTEETQQTAPSDAVMEVKITLNNLYQYFVYKEYPSAIRGEENTDIISSVQVSYGLALREGYTAAKEPEYKHTLQVTFKADGVVKSGNYTVDFDTLQYSGETYSEERETVSETLGFWPEGDRTFIWTFGNYSKSNILYLENFQIISATGTVYLRAA